MLTPKTSPSNNLLSRLFTEMGWQTVSAIEEVFGVGGTLRRETKAEPVLAPRLRAALERLNLSLPPEATSGAIDQLIRDRSAMSLATANWEAYCFLKDGNPASIWEAMLLCQVTLSSDFHTFA